MRIAMAMAMSGLAIGFAASAAAQARTSAQLWQFCTDPHPEVRTLACSIIIESGNETGAALADAYSSRGTAYAVTGKPDEAIADFSAALTLDSSRILVWAYRANAYLGKGDYDHAIADFDRVLAVDANDTDALYGRATAERSKGDSDRAIADYSQVIMMNPAHAAAIANRGIAYRAKGDLDGAITDFDRLIALQPGDAQAFNLRGSAWRDKGDAERALADLGEAVSLMPDDASLRDNRGVAELLFGRFAQAADDLARAVQLQAQHPYRVLWLEMARRKTASAIAGELSRNATLLDLKVWPGPILRLYLSQATAEDVRVAAGAAGDAKTRADHACEAAFYIGELASFTGDTDTARKELSSAAANCPRSFMEYNMAMRELERLP